jgi:hypothetical protein
LSQVSVQPIEACELSFELLLKAPEYGVTSNNKNKGPAMIVFSPASACSRQALAEIFR